MKRHTVVRSVFEKGLKLLGGGRNRGPQMSCGGATVRPELVLATRLRLIRA